MKRVLLVRHAESENNVLMRKVEQELGVGAPGIFARLETERAADPSLSPRGGQQAEQLAASLAARTGKETVVVASPMRRALQTATAIVRRGNGSPLWCQAELYEFGGCFKQGRAEPGATAAELAAAYDVQCHAFGDAGWYAGHEGRETMAEGQARVQRVIAWIEEQLRTGDFDTMVAVSHGEFLFWFLRQWFGVSKARALAFVHGNTGVTELAWGSAGLLLHRLNDLGHLPLHLRSGGGDGWWGYVAADIHVERFATLTGDPAALIATVAARREHLWQAEGTTDANYLESDARSVHFVASVGESFAGCAQYDPETNRLRQMVVLPGFRGKGVGRHLAYNVMAEAKQRGSSSLRVHAWTRSLSFYRRLGFAADGPEQSNARVAWQPMKLRL